MTKTVQTEQAYSRAAITPNSFDKAARTFDVVFATETPVQRRGWDGDFFEVLVCNPKNVRMERLKRGLPVFDNHPWEKKATVQLGRCINIRFEGSEMVGTVKLGARADEALVSDLENGILDGISVGYNVYEFTQDKTIIDKETPTLRATDWEPMEVSFAPVQADINSNIRSNEQKISTTLIINKMTIEEIRAKADDGQKARLDAIILISRAAKLDDAKALELYESDKTVEVIRAENPEIVDTPAPKPEPEKVDLEQVRKDATDLMKSRLDAVLKSTRAANIDDTKALEYFQSDSTIEEIRQAVIEQFVKKDPKMINTDLGTEAIDKKRGAIESVILNRVAPATFKAERSEFSNMSMLEMGKVMLAERGINFATMNKDELARAIMSSRTLSTSDFPYLLENVANKMLRADYVGVPEVWGNISSQTSASDFKAKTMYQVGSANGMTETPEGGEIKYGKLVEAKQSLQLKSYAEGLLFTRQMLINDDLSAFSKIPQKFVQDWDAKRGDLVWAMITGNVTVGSAALFHSTHGNLAGTGAILSDATLKAAITAMKSQKDLSGTRPIRVQPKYLIVSPDYEFTALALLTTIIPNAVSSVNVLSSLGLTVIVENRLSGKAWYLAADPNAVEGLYHAYLDGAEGLRSYREESFDVDSLKLAVRADFGVAAVDYRGWYKNAGE